MMSKCEKVLSEYFFTRRFMYVILQQLGCKNKSIITQRCTEPQKHSGTSSTPLPPSVSRWSANPCLYLAIIPDRMSDLRPVSSTLSAAASAFWRARAAAGAPPTWATLPPAGRSWEKRRPARSQSNSRPLNAGRRGCCEVSLCFQPLLPLTLKLVAEHLLVQWKLF